MPSNASPTVAEADPPAALEEKGQPAVKEQLVSL